MLTTCGSLSSGWSCRAADPLEIALGEAFVGALVGQHALEAAVLVGDSPEVPWAGADCEILLGVPVEVVTVAVHGILVVRRGAADNALCDAACVAAGIATLVGDAELLNLGQALVVVVGLVLELVGVA